MTRSASNLADLERLAKDLGARFTLDIDGRTGALDIRVTWKAPRYRAERVTDYGRHASSERVLDVLMTRLGYAGVPTTDATVDHLTDEEIARIRALMAEVRAITKGAQDRL